MLGEMLLVAGREVSEKLRNRGFLAFGVFMLLIALGGPFLGALLGEPDGERYTVGLAGGDSAALGAAIREQARASGAEVEVERLPSAEAAEEAVREGDADVAVVGGRSVLSDGRPDPALRALLQSSAGGLRVAQALQSAGVSPGEAREALNPELLRFQDVGEEQRGGSPVALLLAYAGVGLLFVAIFTYGYWIASGVVEEKTSRVVEVVLSAIGPSRLLAGKILGIGLLGLGQLVILGVFSLLAALLAGFEVPSDAYGVAGSILLWFVLGYAFYACLFAVAGSLVSKQEDVQYTQTPVMVLIFVGYGAAFYLLGNPDSLVAQVLSFLPPFAPVVMPVRVGLGQVGITEVALAVLLTVATTAVLVVLAARLYAGSVLRFGARVPLLEAWRGSAARE